MPLLGRRITVWIALAGVECSGEEDANNSTQTLLCQRTQGIARARVRAQHQSGATNDRRAQGRCVETRALVNPAFFASVVNSSRLNAACTEAGPSCIEI